MRDLEGSPPRLGADFYPNSSKEIDSQHQVVSSFEMTSHKPVTGPNSALLESRKAGMRTGTGYSGARQEKSPISLRKIIDKLE